MKRSKTSIIQILVFVLFLAALLVLHLALPDRSLAGRESLQSLPRFTFSSLFKGKFTSDVENYVNDQFPFRSDWIAMKARAELLSGKAENNGVYLCENETLIEPFDASRYFSVDPVNALAEHVDAPVCFALIPTASEVWREKLPQGAPNDSQKGVIDLAYDNVNTQTVDLYAALYAHRDEPIYYRTDHHWTTLGAYYGYAALGDALGYEPIPLSAYSPTTVTEDFYGTAWSNSGFSWVRPDTIISYVNQGDAVVEAWSAGQTVPASLYAPEKLEGIDKYAYFFGGNTPLLTVKTGHEGPKLLILRDSFMDSLSPFLLPHFSELHIMDLRYYKDSVQDYIREHGIDRVLVCYSVTNFVQDSNLFLMGN